MKTRQKRVVWGNIVMGGLALELEKTEVDRARGTWYLSLNSCKVLHGVV